MPQVESIVVYIRLNSVPDLDELHDKAPRREDNFASGAFFICGIARFISFTHGYVEKKEMLIARKVYTMEEE